MTQEDKQLLLQELCAMLPYGIMVDRLGVPHKVLSIKTDSIEIDRGEYMPASYYLDEVKPYLRPMSSMTEEEAKYLSVLYGLEDILSIKITDEYIEVVVDDGFCSTEIRTIWYDEIISSIEIFDWLNAHCFDFRGMIEKGLAIEAPEGMYEK